MHSRTPGQSSRGRVVSEELDNKLQGLGLSGLAKIELHQYCARMMIVLAIPKEARIRGSDDQELLNISP